MLAKAFYDAIQEKKNIIIYFKNGAIKIDTAKDTYPNIGRLSNNYILIEMDSHLSIYPYTSIIKIEVW